MKRSLFALTLTFAFSIQAFGGDIPISDLPAPPCTNCPAMSEPSPGEIPSVGIALVAREGLLDLVAAFSSLAF
jgi:hypothetical protein